MWNFIKSSTIHLSIYPSNLANKYLNPYLFQTLGMVMQYDEQEMIYSLKLIVPNVRK